MKQFRIYYRIVLAVISMTLFSTTLMAAEKMDSVEIGLITCTPHEEIYSLYGHTAIRYHNYHTGEDLVFNYGVFNFKAPHFVSRFVLGKTDYELGIIPIEPFCKYYRDWGSEVTEQLLNLTNDEKARIIYALAINYRPENRIYRYNFFYDNCSTRPRDIIANNLLGEIIYEPRPDFSPSYREMIHELTAHHPWAAMGNDLLLGFKADRKTDREQQEFLPMNLMYDFDRAQIRTGEELRPLVKERRILIKGGEQIVEEDFPLSPTACAWLLLALFMAVFAFEVKTGRHLAGVDALSILFTGGAGVLLLVMFFSEHPTTSTNLQIFLLNPFALPFIPSVLRGRKTHRYWRFLLASLLLFFLGWFVQDYAEGMEILALCLLSRYCSYRITNRLTTPPNDSER